VVTPLLLLMNISKNIVDDKSLTDAWLVMFTNTCRKRAPFQMQTAVLDVKYNEMWRRRNMLRT
jgi:hypothetical protein